MSEERRPGSRWSVLLLGTLLLGIVALCGGCEAGRIPSPETSRAETPWFDDVTAAVGIGFRHDSGAQGRYWFPEIMGGGVGLLDADGDGWLDIYLVQSGDLGAPGESPGNRLYLHTDDGSYQDVTEEYGVGDRGYGMGCACGDYDGDGDVDLYVTNLGANVLYRNDGGSFTDVTEAAGVDERSWSTSAAFLDHDGDGDLDLFVANYVTWSIATHQACHTGSGRQVYCSPNQYRAPAPDTLYRNDGDGTFTDVSDAAGVRSEFGNGLGVACADYDGNGHTDIYVANDLMPNQLWLNRGDGTFRNEALIRGCAVNGNGVSEAGMGVQVVDIDGDGDEDLFVSHLRQETNTFYRNRGDWFDDDTAAMGLADTSLEFTGFGLGFADFDHDGRRDLYVANGRVVYWDPPLSPTHVHAEPNQLFAASGELSFREVLPRGGTDPVLVGTSRGAAFGDLDNDGDIDIVVGNKDAAPHVLRNRVGDRGHWIRFRVVDEAGREALHARVVVEAGERVWHSIVQRAYSYCSSHDPRVHMGLGAAERVDRVRVRWPGGVDEEFGALPADREHELRRGQGRP